MKIENTGSGQMLHKGVTENSDKYIKSKEAERKQAAVETKPTVSSFISNKGSYLDTKA